MSIKYHVNPETGRPNICRAKTPESCLYYDSKTSTEAPHFDTKEAARTHAEKELDKEHGKTGISMSKKISMSKGAVSLIEKETTIIEKMRNNNQEFLDLSDKYPPITNLIDDGNSYKQLALEQVYNDSTGETFIWSLKNNYSAPSDYQIIHNKIDGKDSWAAFTKFNVEYQSQPYSSPEECFKWFNGFTTAYKNGEIKYDDYDYDEEGYF